MIRQLTQPTCVDVLDHDGQDLRLGLRAMFAGAREGYAEMYLQPGLRTVHGVDLAEILCGLLAPGYVGGMAIMAAKPSWIVRPDRACCGDKHFHPLRAIERTTSELNFPTGFVTPRRSGRRTIERCPAVTGACAAAPGGGGARGCWEWRFFRGPGGRGRSCVGAAAVHGSRDVKPMRPPIQSAFGAGRTRVPSQSNPCPTGWPASHSSACRP